MLMLALIAVLAIPLVFGLVSSWRQRRIDRRHFAAFVGFSSALLAVVLEAAMIPVILADSLRFRTPPWQAFSAIVGIITFLSLGAALVSGIFSREIHRVTLILSVLVIGFTWLLIAAAGFGN